MDLKDLESIAASCTLCDLHKGRIKAVFSKGNPNASTFICGMVPAHEENKVGIPFVGKAGQLLDVIMAEAGFDMHNVYITNLVKCCLSPGLKLEQNWIDHCFPYLLSQIRMIRPSVIIALGADAANTILGNEKRVALKHLRKVQQYNDYTSIICTYHPSYLLRGGGQNHKDYSNVIKDFELARTIVWSDPEARWYNAVNL